MTSNPDYEKELREKILSEPDLVLDDQAVMRALISANEKSMGSNIVDLRGVAMNRLEDRLDRLEDTHRSVIAAAYDNLAGTNQVHRAILRLMDGVEFEHFMADLQGDVAEILRIDSIRLVLETRQTDMDAAAALSDVSDVITLVIPGFVEAYLTGGRDTPTRPVTLRTVGPASEQVFGEDAGFIKTEACLKLDFGPGRLPAMLVLGSDDPQHFTSQQGTDLLAFFGGVFERVMRRYLA
mgnify:CR=1 FL=1